MPARLRFETPSKRIFLVSDLNPLVGDFELLTTKEILKGPIHVKIVGSDQVIKCIPVRLTHFNIFLDIIMEELLEKPYRPIKC